MVHGRCIDLCLFFETTMNVILMEHGLSDSKVMATFFLITYNQERYVREAIERA